jgi:hypothetical protein
MGTGSRTAMIVLAASIAGAAVAARAEPTLSYNYDYVCTRGLRIVVGHCRRDSDLPGVAPTAPEDDYCQIYYPDRPKTGGIEAMETVLRGDLIQSLQACGALDATASGASGKQNPVAAAPQRTASPAEAPPAGATPDAMAPATRGRQEFWMVGMTEDRHTMFFVDKASILRRSGGKAEFRRERIENSSGKVAWLKQRSEIDCNRRISRDLEVFAYRDDETLIGAVQPAPEAAIRESTVGARILAFVCQGKEDTAVKLATGESTIMFFAIEQGDEGLDRSPASAPAATAPGGRPPVKPMPIGPAMCPLLRRLEGLAHEDFRSIELGPDRAFGKDADKIHRTSMPIPGVKCNIYHDVPGDPVTYSCMWPEGKQAMDQFVSMVQALQKCTGGTADLTKVQKYEMPDATMTLRGVEYRTMVTGGVNDDFLSLDVRMAKP